MKTERDWDEAIRDVRGAYRLVALYQRRILDLLRLTSDAFDKHQFAYWKAAHTHPVPRGDKDIISPGYWAWDYIPLCDFSILLVPERTDATSIQPGETMVEINVSIDSEFEGPEYEGRNKIEPNPMKWDALEEATAGIQMIFWTYQGSKPLKETWKQAWFKIEIGDALKDEEVASQVKEYDEMSCAYIEWPLTEFMGSDDPRPFVEQAKNMVATTLAAYV
ncbi:hypothetical protein [uncultured Limimaricola sp.]|uniref:hypothetical protein n=1 Tax=uncultured Limimaricola sp. TaxID=2211667 RepID=UPI0030F60821